MGNPRLRLLLVDNYDSFTYNLYQYLAEINHCPPVVITHDHPWESLDFSAFDAVVISPGPGRPDRTADFGICRRIIETCPLPILGICLGHQGIGLAHGSILTLAPEPVHGRSSLIEHHSDPIFEGIPSRFEAIRYHSLLLSELGDELKAIAWTGSQVMAIRHVSRPLWGLQFHPESIGTQYGKKMLENFILQGKNSGAATTEPLLSSPTKDAESSGVRTFTLVYREVSSEHQPDAVFPARYGGADHSFWLDSTRTEKGTARFSYMGDASGPDSLCLRYQVDGGEMVIHGESTATSKAGTCLGILQGLMAENEVLATETPFEFKGGLVGYIGYEIKGETGGTIAHTSPHPDAQFIFATRYLVFDHWAERWFVCALVRDMTESSQHQWINDVCTLLKTPIPSEPRCSSQRHHLSVGQSAEAYTAKIRKALDLIREGESYEVCLTTQCVGGPLEDPLGVYLTLRRGHDVPFGCYLAFEHLKIASVSPERFLQVRASGAMEAKPIKGTAARYEDPDRDQRSARMLAESEKERSENLMIVDLLRNDLGRVSQIGSVDVPKLMEIESYAVHQMVSTVTGQLAQGMDALDALKAAFPGGSMTGAPKVRTMEIIDALEDEARGVYSGSIGYLSLDGAADFNIVIRTIVMTPQETRIGVGGAIVALSDPQAEWREVLLKGQSVLNPLKGHLEA